MSSDSSATMVYLSEVDPPPNVVVHWERCKRKAPLLIQCIAEAFGTFIYTYAGTSSTASYVLGNLLGVVNFGSLFQIGIAYALGITIAVILCIPTSGGYLNPGFTIYAMTMGKCRYGRGCALIVAQILGSFIGCLLVYVQWHNDFEPVIAALKAKGVYDALMFTATGPAGIIAFYVPPGTNLGYVFVNEFLCDFLLATVIIGSMDPTNHHCSVAIVPWLAGLTYAVIIWGFAGPGLAANAARDVGGRLAALCIWGTPAAGGAYAAISALTSIPASILGGLFYKFVLADHSRPLAHEHVEHMRALKAAADRAATLDGRLPAESSPSVRDFDSISKA